MQNAFEKVAGKKLRIIADALPLPIYASSQMGHETAYLSFHVLKDRKCPILSIEMKNGKQSACYFVERWKRKPILRVRCNGFS